MVLRATTPTTDPLAKTATNPPAKMAAAVRGTAFTMNFHFHYSCGGRSGGLLFQVCAVSTLWACRDTFREARRAVRPPAQRWDQGPSLRRPKCPTGRPAAG